MSSEILAADIGATSCRFAHFRTSDEGIKLLSSKWLRTSEQNSFAGLLHNLAESDFSLTPKEADIVSIGVAGPIEDGVYCKPPYISWEIDFSCAERDYGFSRYCLINDFVAQAYACKSPIAQMATQVVDGKARRDATIAVIGAGSNLGKAIVAVREGGNYIVVPSEGGHITFPLQSRRELEFAQFVLTRTAADYLTCNEVISGKGLSRIHEFLTGECLEPSEVSARFADHNETLLWASRFYGRVCRNFALDTLALGGVFIAGGVAAKVPQLVKHPAFREEFVSSPRHNELLSTIPVYLIVDEESGLWGAAMCGAKKLCEVLSRE